MKFSPEEMAYDVPDDTSHFVPVGRGPGALFAKPPKELLRYWKRQLAVSEGYVRLDTDVRRAFPNDRSVNKALRKVIELQQLRPIGKLKKSA